MRLSVRGRFCWSYDACVREDTTGGTELGLKGYVRFWDAGGLGKNLKNLSPLNLITL